MRITVWQQQEKISGDRMQKSSKYNLFCYSRERKATLQKKKNSEWFKKEYNHILDYLEDKNNQTKKTLIIYFDGVPRVSDRNEHDYEESKRRLQKSKDE